MEIEISYAFDSNASPHYRATAQCENECITGFADSFEDAEKELMEKINRKKEVIIPPNKTITI